MPSEGKPPLKAEQIAWIKAWIAQGASPELKTLAGISVREEEPPPPPVADYSGLMAQISQAAKAAGVTLVPVSRNLRDGLILNTVDAGTKFGDAQLASLEKFAPYIVEVELGRTSVTDAQLCNAREVHSAARDPPGGNRGDRSRFGEADATAATELSQPEWHPGDAGGGCSTFFDEEPASPVSLQHAGPARTGCG